MISFSSGKHRSSFFKTLLFLLATLSCVRWNWGFGVFECYQKSLWIFGQSRENMFLWRRKENECLWRRRKRLEKPVFKWKVFLMVMWREIYGSLWTQFGFCVFFLVWPLRRRRRSLAGFVACARLARVASQRAILWRSRKHFLCRWDCFYCFTCCCSYCRWCYPFMHYNSPSFLPSFVWIPGQHIAILYANDFSAPDVAQRSLKRATATRSPLSGGVSRGPFLSSMNLSRILSC